MFEGAFGNCVNSKTSKLASAVIQNDQGVCFTQNPSTDQVFLLTQSIPMNRKTDKNANVHMVAYMPCGTFLRKHHAAIISHLMLRLNYFIMIYSFIVYFG